jgi:methyl-accepting chemotaxis protein
VLLALRNSSVTLKVAMAPLVAIVCLLAVGLIGAWSTRDLVTSLQGLQARTLPSLASMNDLQRRVGAVFAATNQSLAWTGAQFPTARIAELDKATMTELAALKQKIAQESESSNYDDAVRVQLQAVSASYGKFERAAMDTLDVKSAGLMVSATFMEQLGDRYRELDGQVLKLSVRIRDTAGASVDESASAASSKTLAIAAASAAALLVAALSALLGARLIVQPLKQAERLAREVANGDIVVRLISAGNDETGRVLGALSQVASNLNGMVKEIRDTAQQIDAASSEIATGNMDLSARTECSASALQEAAASVEELAAAVRSSADSAREASGMARDASMVAQHGGETVLDVVSTMEAINAQAKRISEIIATIDGIAFQTNILALNAAVEAARAGEQGRGFSVVASEVRSLAQRSSEAAREIRALISDSVQQIADGTSKARDAGETMVRVVDAAKRVALTVDEISQASAEQASGIAQVSQTVSEMDRSTQQNAALVEQASAAAESLRQQAAQLVGSIGRFQVE